MKTQPNKSRYLPLFIVGIAVILFSTAGIAAIKGWLPATNDGSDDLLALQKPSVASTKAIAVAARTTQRLAIGKARANGTCAECGRIVSMGKIGGHDGDFGVGAVGGPLAEDRDEKLMNSAKGYEIIVRMADGSNRMISHATPANWQPGTRVIIVDGTIPSRR